MRYEMQTAAVAQESTSSMIDHHYHEGREKLSEAKVSHHGAYRVHAVLYSAAEGSIYGTRG